MSKLKFFLLVLGFVLTVPSLVFASDTLTITTYYPSPYGVYNEMRSTRMAIGSDYIDNTQYCWTGSCTNAIAATTNLVVEGNVGIGTTSPATTLQVNGSSLLNGVYLGYNNSTSVGNTADGQMIQLGMSRLDYNLILKLNQNGNVGIGTTSPTYTLDVNGNIHVSDGNTLYVSPTRTNSDWYVCQSGGHLTLGSSCSASDGRFKTNIQTLIGVMPKLLDLRAVTFNWKDTKRFGTSQKQIGLIAQEIEAQFPELVLNNPDGTKSLDYARFTSVLLEGLKEQQAQIDALKQEISQLEEKLKPAA